MSIFKSYKKTLPFLLVNITGLAIGLACSIMLILFVINELSYDKHFENGERIVRLLSALEENGEIAYYPIDLRKAYTELPARIPAIEQAAQIYKGWGNEVIYEKEHFQNLELFYVDAEFLDIFQMKFIEGTPKTALKDPYTLIITKPFADIIFGSAGEAMYKKLSINEEDYTILGVVEQLPSNTHFTFDLLTNLRSAPYLENYGGLEFFTYYLIKENASLADTRTEIEKVYTEMLQPFAEYFNETVYGETELLTDIYLHSKADFGLGSTNDVKSIRILILLAIVILLLAVTNFINLFMAQGEGRMNEIGIRKSNGAEKKDIIKLFFREVTFTVMIAFVAGFLLALIITPYFSVLIGKPVDFIQLLNPAFIICITLLFIFTVIITASYPSFYLSSFNPLEILEKRIRFSKRRLTSILVIFQSVITIVLISYIFVINKQTMYLENMPKGYDTENILNFMLNKKTVSHYKTIKEELLKSPAVENVSGGHHIIGMGYSGQGIALPENRENQFSINEYRIMPGMCELMGFQLKEGEFFKEDQPEGINRIILNEAAVKMLGLEYPVAKKHVYYKGEAEIAAVVKDFIYAEPTDKIQPLVMSTNYVNAKIITIRFSENIQRANAETIALNTLRMFDPEFVVNPVWSDDIYRAKFESIKTHSQIVLAASLLSLFISMLGLIAIHLYATIRRVKEIGIRRINGASRQAVFILLSKEIIKWMIIAGIIAIPVAYYIAGNWLNNYANHTTLSWYLFFIPVILQCVIAILTTSGVSWHILSRNPVEALKKE